MNNIPTMTKNLLIINVLVFIATWVFGRGGFDLTSQFGLHFFLASDFRVYQFLTYMFLHGGFQHILFNMFALWMFGSVIERVWGPKKFLFYYIVCGVGAGITQEIVQYVDYSIQGLSAYQYVSVGNGVRMAMDQYLNLRTTIGASGAVYGILLAFGMIFPNERLFIIPFPFPIKAKWLIIGYFAIELFSALSSPGDGVAHMAHLGGMIFGFFLIRYWRNHPDSSQRFNRGKGQEFFENLKRKFDERQEHRQAEGDTADARRETDEEYNMRQRQNQEEIDAILDKIRKSGYDSLSKEEKRKLFDQSRSS